MTKGKKLLILTAALELLKPANRATTLEIKNQLRSDFPKEKWFQDDVSEVMDEFSQQGKFTYSDTGTYRIYSQVTPKKKLVLTKSMAGSGPSTTISGSKALKMLDKVKGRFFTATYIDKKGEEKVMNCQHKHTAKVTALDYLILGYLPVIDVSESRRAGKPVKRKIDLKTLKNLKVLGKTYKVR